MSYISERSARISHHIPSKAQASMERKVKRYGGGGTRTYVREEDVESYKVLEHVEFNFRPFLVYT
jgi:hypothetical protein